jgi:hypothetical protein
MGIRNEVGPNISIGRYLSSTPFLFPLSHFPSSYREIKETYHLSKFLEITNILHRSILILKTSKRMISRLAISEEPPLLKELSGWSVLPSAPSSRITNDRKSYSLAHYQSYPSISIEECIIRCSRLSHIIYHQPLSFCPLIIFFHEGNHVQCLEEAGFGFSGVGGALETDGTQKQSKYPIPNLPFTGPRISILSNSRPVIAPRVLLTLVSATHIRQKRRCGGDLLDVEAR